MTNMFIYTSKFLSIKSCLTWIAMAIGACISFTFTSYALFYVFTGTFVLDTVTGILASISRGEQLNSHRFRESIYKLLAYLSVLLIAAGLGCAFPALAWVSGAALGWVILTDAISVLENCEVVLGKKVPFLSRIKKVLEALKNDGTNT